VNYKILIQARTGSTRLPNKMLLPFFNGSTILEIVIDRLIKEFGVQNIVLATTENKHDDSLEQVAKQKAITCFRGDEQNVLKRFIDCAEKFETENIVRVCADNPFLDVQLLSKLIAFATKEKCDYASYKVNNVPAIKTHYGFFAEYVSLKALKKVSTDTNDKFFQEHVTNYIYTNPDGFVIKWMNAPELIEANSDVRLTVDTMEDFEICKSIYSELESDFSYASILKLINVNPELQNKMSSQIQKNGK
jgi:spore coat polysaccharide biosynthesis protein SpsF (cytidylyltransferase family)